MGIISRGSKSAVFKSNLRLNLNSVSVEDSKVAATHIFAKIMDDGSAIVFGDFTIFLLLCYLDSEKQKNHLTESLNVKFNESIPCYYPAALDNKIEKIQRCNARSSFEPRVSCTRGVGNVWNIEVKGSFEVVIYEKNAAFETENTDNSENIENTENTKNTKNTEDIDEPQNNADSVTVMQINDPGITADQLLDMDTESIKNISESNDVNTETDAPLM